MFRLNFMSKSYLVNCWSLLIKFVSAILVHIVYTTVSFEATFKR